MRTSASFLALTFVLLAPAVASAQTRGTTLRARFDQPGDITFAANSIMSCRSGSLSGLTLCDLARTTSTSTVNDNDYPMVPVDADNGVRSAAQAALTFDSSESDLVLPAGATVTWAGLYWQCITSGGTTAAPDAARRNHVLFATPTTDYTDVTASVLNDSGAIYQAYADVTSMVSAPGAGAGAYWVGNVQCDSGATNHYGGWSLVVVYRDDSAPLRDLAVYDAWSTYDTTAVTLNISGFVTPPTGTVRSRVGVVFYDGDRGNPDSLTLSSGALTTALGSTPGVGVINPNNDIGNGTVTRLGANVTTRVPSYVNTLGFDADYIETVGALPNSATTATIRAVTSGEFIAVGVITFATDIFAPDIDLQKTVTDVNGGDLVPGDLLEYTVVATNDGADPAMNVVLRDVIPTGTTYEPGTLSIDATAMTDGAGDDRGEYDAAGTRIVARLGTGATASAGGRMNTGATTTVRFRVRVAATTPGAEPIRNTAIADYTGLTLGTGVSFSGSSDGDPGEPGTQPTVITTTVRCGDARISPPETCDDGNTTALDGCSATCRVEVAITSPRGETTTNPRPPITGTGDVGATVVVRIDGTVVGMATVSAAGTWSVTPTAALSDGTHAIVASATNTAGGTSSASSTVVVDTGTNVAILTPANGSTTTDPTPTISGTGEPGAMVTVEVDGVLVGMVTVSAAGTWTIDAPMLVDGPHVARAVARDTSGFMAMASSTFTVDTGTRVAITAPAEGATTNDATPDVSGTGEPGATVTVEVDGSVVAMVTVSAGGTWTLVAPMLADGPHTVRATARDAAGFTASDDGTFRVDTGTSIAIVAPDDGSTITDATPTISGTGEPGATVTIEIDGAVVGTVTVAPDGTWTFTSAMLADGGHSARATARDTAGFTASDDVAFTIDTATTVAITAPGNGSTSNVVMPVITGTGEAGATVVVTLDGATLGTVTVAADGRWSVPTGAPLADGPHTAVANATDGGGATATASSSFTVDSGTNVTIVQPGDLGDVGDATPEISGTCEPGASVAVRIDGTTVATVTCDAEGNWSFVPTSDLADGPHTVVVTATDTTGNVATDDATFTVDTTAPSLEIRTPVDGSRTNDTTPVISGDADPGASVIVLVDGTAIGTVIADVDGHWSIVPATSLAEGPHTARATTTDAAGNTSTDEHDFEVDLTAPSIDLTMPPDGDATADNTPTIGGTADPGVTVQVFVDGVLVGTTTAAPDGTWSVVVGDPLADGTRAVRAVATDAGGNTATDAGSFVVDTTTEVAITRPADGSRVGSVRPTITGTAEAGASVEVSVDGTVIGTTVAGADGTWTMVPTSDLTNGVHTAEADATDAVGNTAHAESSFTIDPSMLDTDGDGISDADECPSTPCRDTDGDGHPDFDDPDDDGDGLPTAVECSGAPCEDHDGDGTPDYLDDDDDDDGIPTEDEAPGGTPRDTDSDGTPDHLDDDDDGDGLLTMDECGSRPCRDTDADSMVDYLDPDDDGDGIPTTRERADGAMFGDDVDGDGDPNWLDTESDGDGALDRSEGIGDADGDGVPNYLDPDGDVPDGGIADGGARDGGVADGGLSDGSVGPDGSTVGPRPPGGYAGGACQCTVPGATSRRLPGTGLVLVGLAFVLVALGRRRGVAAASLAVALAVAAPAGAQDGGFDLDAFRSAETGIDGFALSRPNDLGHLDFGARLTFDYAHDPLVYEDTSGDMGSERLSIVEHQLVGNAAFSLGLFERLVIYAGLPVTLVSQGEGGGVTGFPGGDGVGVGDPYLGGRVRLFGEHNDAFALAIQLALSFPLAEAAMGNQLFSGDRSVVFLPRIAAEIRAGDRVRIPLNVGGRFREGTPLFNTTVSHELTYGLGVTVVAVPDVFDLMVEGYGSTSFEHFFEREESPFELLGGLQVHPVCEMTIGAAAGGGVARGIGASDFRGVLELAYAHQPHCHAPPPTPVVDEVEPVVGDTDGDGLLDPDDGCPLEPEDVDTFEDADGCPDPDNDRDGVLDVDDGAPMDPEDPDAFEDTDGVPDPDNDQDTIPDERDGAPNDPEDFDGFADGDGIPDVDNDGDTVLDVDDACPLAPGAVEERGCPRAVRLDVETGTIYILERVEFATNRDVILERSFPVLEEVRAILLANPSLERLRIEGHTDSRGRDSRNLDLSVRRARSVEHWLIEHGIPSERLEAWGCGETHPTETNETSDGRQANRRVEFHILSPVPPAGARILEGCLEAAD